MHYNIRLIRFDDKYIHSLRVIIRPLGRETDAGQIINLTYNCTNSAEKALMSRGQLLTCALQMSTVGSRYSLNVLKKPNYF